MIAIKAALVFGAFNLPIKASPIKRAKKYSDVKISKPGIGSRVVHASKPNRGENGFELDCDGL